MAQVRKREALIYRPRSAICIKLHKICAPGPHACNNSSTMKGVRF